LDQANCEVVQKNLTTDFMRIALTHREEITKLLEQQEEIVRALHAEMEAVAEPVVPAAQERELQRKRRTTMLPNCGSYMC
jgi:hypothetical protein